MYNLLHLYCPIMFMQKECEGNTNLPNYLSISYKFYCIFKCNYGKSRCMLEFKAYQNSIQI